jgi:hypothetical protein
LGCWHLSGQKGKRAKGVQMTEQQPKTPRIIDIVEMPPTADIAQMPATQDIVVVYEMEFSDWFFFLYSDWWMSDRLKYSYSVPLRTHGKCLKTSMHRWDTVAPFDS